jgi:hypothetical protein
MTPTTTTTTATATGTARDTATKATGGTGTMTPTRGTATRAAAPATASRQNGGVARMKLTRRFGPVGAVLTAWDIWRRLPPGQRKWVAKQVRHHGPRVAKQALQAQRNRRRR